MIVDIRQMLLPVFLADVIAIVMTDVIVILLKQMLLPHMCCIMADVIAM